MIFDFDLTDAPERRTSAYNALGSINTKLIVSAPCRACTRLVDGLSAFIIIQIRRSTPNTRIIIHCHPAIRLACVRLARPPGGDAFLFFIIFMQHTQYTLLFFVHIAKSQFFSKNLLTISEKYDII